MLACKSPLSALCWKRRCFRAGLFAAVAIALVTFTAQAGSFGSAFAVANDSPSRADHRSHSGPTSRSAMAQLRPMPPTVNGAHQPAVAVIDTPSGPSAVFIRPENEKKKVKHEFEEPIEFTKENTTTGAAVAASILAMMVGGTKLAGLVFVVASYFAKKRDDDVSKALESFGENAIEGVNWAHFMVSKYEVPQNVEKKAEEAWGAVGDGEMKTSVRGMADELMTNMSGADFGGQLGIFCHSASETASDFARDLVGLEADLKLSETVTKTFNQVLEPVRQFGAAVMAGAMPQGQQEVPQQGQLAQGQMPQGQVPQKQV